MAVTRKENVIRIDADNDTVDSTVIISSVRVVGSGSAQIRADADAAGMILWDSGTVTDAEWQDVKIQAHDGIHVDLTGVVLYIYS